MKNKILSFLLSMLLSGSLLSGSALSQACLAAVTETSEGGAVKVPALVQEESVSTYVPSTSAGERGVAVNVILPEKAR